MACQLGQMDELKQAVFLYSIIKNLKLHLTLLNSDFNYLVFELVQELATFVPQELATFYLQFLGMRMRKSEAAVPGEIELKRELKILILKNSRVVLLRRIEIIPV
jgi:hypothetical protein